MDKCNVYYVYITIVLWPYNYMDKYMQVHYCNLQWDDVVLHMQIAYNHTIAT